MAPDISHIQDRAVLLTDESLGVSTETTPRKIQENGDGYHCSLNPDWLDQLNLAEQSEMTLHSMSMGMKPVIVQNPAIIIQPADVLPEDY